MEAFAKFLKTLGLATLCLCLIAGLLGSIWPALHAGFGIAGVLLMAANAFAAVGILRLRLRPGFGFGMEPAKLILISMAVRLALLVAIMIAVGRLVSPPTALYSFMLSAMAGYVVFQVVEVRFLTRNPGLLAK